MRTKTLLIAAAAMAAGVATSMAQTTYSQNVVGYANVVLKGNGQFSLVANPFDDGNGNIQTNILAGALPKQSQLLTWTGSTFALVTKGGSPAVWGSAVSLPPGQGFFIRNGAPGGGSPDVTNTFVGSIIVNVGNSVTNDEPVGFSLQGSPIPYAGNLAILGSNDGDPNMDFGGGLTKQSQILTWNPVAQTFGLATKGGSPATWGATVPVNVGDGFFVNNKNGPDTNVVETLNP